MFCKNAALFGRLIVEPCWRVQDKPRRYTNIPPLHILHNKHHQGPNSKTLSNPHVWPAATDSSVPFGEAKAEERAVTKRREMEREQTQKKSKKWDEWEGAANQSASRLDSISKFTGMFLRKSSVKVYTFKRYWIVHSGSAGKNNGVNTSAIQSPGAAKLRQRPSFEKSAKFHFL